jgi:hypothetical protein
MAASTMGVERQSNYAPAPKWQTALPPREEPTMERVAIVARLKEGSEQRAAELVEAGPPFDLSKSGIGRHSIYISASEVVFVFEGHEVESIIDQLIDEPFHYELQRAPDQSREIVDEQLRVARERFGWQLDAAAAGTARAGQRSVS